MIGVVSGTVRHGCVLTASGVGYRVESLEPLEENADVELVVETVSGPNDARLFAFPSTVDRDAFVALCRLPGIGPAAAMSVLRQLGVGGLCAAVTAGDVAAVSRAKGVGTRSAQTVVSGFDPAPFAGHAGPAPANGAHDHLDVLIALGYRELDARAALDGLSGDDQEVLGAALARLAEVSS